MTREDAIRIIENTFQDAYVYKYYDSITHQALNMAIEALSSEPTDLISRADAIEAVENNSYGMGSRASIKAIKALPSADAVQVVRCKDCKWNMDDYMGTWCSRLSGFHGTNADDFCSYGECEGGEDE